ncbi:MobA/MobL family protein [Salmonella enterica subsp. enterica serovar Enteritidis]|nr:MobA/MobL family protein [Salmonella enterica subsp. enterica serovar Enteritidis]EHJ6017148.1 MobA/MobL family protein [Salmonella enterica subsp. enterica serovar Enteritidis]EHJ9908174.1 MobA/MobL family protein [Salmonella enterica subsp. enterica serovar Enteritidis]
MAIFHIDFKILKRSEGKSSLYLSAYNSRTRLKDEKTGLVFNYKKKKEDLMHTDILLPNNAPERFKNRSVLWNEVEKQKRKDSQLSRYFICALPRDLSLQENKKLLEEYIQKNFIKKGMCADYAIHNDAENNNPHAHVMLTLQDVNETGFLNKNREWNKKENIDIWRRSWSVSINKYLRQNKKSDYVTHLSFLKQRELLIEKAKQELEKNNLDDAEKYLNAYNDFKNKKPKKRKPRHTYLNRKNHKNKLKNYNQQLEDIKKKKEDMKKENKLTSFFKNVFNKLTNKQQKETEERKQREIEAMKQWKKNEEKRAELREKLKNENLNEEINYVDKIQNIPTRDQNHNIPTHKYKI